MAGGFDASVHISEEASNARTAVPWAIISSVGIAGILGFSKSSVSVTVRGSELRFPLVINIVVALFMGTDMESIMSNPIGQPMATVRSFSRMSCSVRDSLAPG